MGMAIGHFLCLAGGGHKGPHPHTQGSGATGGGGQEVEGTALAAGSGCLSQPVLLPRQLGEVWVWWGLAGGLQEGPVLPKNADPSVVK